MDNKDVVVGFVLINIINIPLRPHLRTKAAILPSASTRLRGTAIVGAGPRYKAPWLVPGGDFAGPLVRLSFNGLHGGKVSCGLGESQGAGEEGENEEFELHGDG